MKPFCFTVLRFFFIRQSDVSTWKNLWRKLRTLLPFLWPKKSPLLQFTVAICFVILILGRVFNLLIPIFYKRIGNYSEPLDL
jgi:hypothetical protein